jgi:hypothetical protein
MCHFEHQGLILSKTVNGHNGTDAGSRILLKQTVCHEFGLVCRKFGFLCRTRDKKYKMLPNYIYVLTG